MVELVPKTAKIVLSNIKGDFEETTLEKLLPYAFEEFEGDND
jgi:cytidine deaminase